MILPVQPSSDLLASKISNHFPAIFSSKDASLQAGEPSVFPAGEPSVRPPQFDTLTVWPEFEGVWGERWCSLPQPSQYVQQEKVVTLNPAPKMPCSLIVNLQDQARGTIWRSVLHTPSSNLSTSQVLCWLEPLSFLLWMAWSAPLSVSLGVSGTPGAMQCVKLAEATGNPCVVRVQTSPILWNGWVSTLCTIPCPLSFSYKIDLWRRNSWSLSGERCFSHFWRKVWWTVGLVPFALELCPSTSGISSFRH